MDRADPGPLWGPGGGPGYLMAFYMKGLMAVIEQWLKNDCRDSVERIAGLMQKFVKEP